jgi:hypothetical protein
MISLLSAALPATGWGQVRVGAEFQVNTYTTGSQTHARVASDADGNFVVTWDSDVPTPGAVAVFARRFDASGAPLDANEFQVSTGTLVYDGNPLFLSSDQGGNFVVVWRRDVTVTDVFARMYDAAGTAGAAFRVNSYTTSAQVPGGVASDAIGNFVVVWTTYLEDGSQGGVAARRYDAFGAPRGGPFQVNTYTTGYQRSASVGSDAYGNFLVAWYSPGQDGGEGGVYAQCYDAGGGARGGEFRVNTSTIGNQGYPSVASDLDGNVVVVWTGPDGNGAGIFGQRYDVAGMPQGGEFRVNTFTTANQVSAVVSADARGFVVAWSSFGQDNSSYAVMARRYGDDGAPVGDAFLVNTNTTNRQGPSSVASTDGGGFVIVWTSLNQDGHLDGVFGQRFASDLLFRDGFE